MNKNFKLTVTKVWAANHKQYDRVVEEFDTIAEVFKWIEDNNKSAFTTGRLELMHTTLSHYTDQVLEVMGYSLKNHYYKYAPSDDVIYYFCIQEKINNHETKQNTH